MPCSFLFSLTFAPEVPFRDLRFPRNRNAARPQRNPSRPAVTQVSNFLQMRHEFREILHSAPERKHFFHRRDDVNRLLEVHRIGTADSEYLPEVLIRDGACQQTDTGNSTRIASVTSSW